MKFANVDKVIFYTEKEDVKIPKRATYGSAGHDFITPEEVTVNPGETVIIDSLVKSNIPVGYVLLMFPRSSSGIKKHLALANTVGVIDCDYKDTIKIALYNYGTEAVVIEKGDRIAQAICVPCIISKDDPTDTTRYGGIGSTGR